MDSRVFIVKTKACYPTFPFPEKKGHIWESLQRLFKSMDWDPDNPFKHLIRPGAKILIKPNWVADHNLKVENLDSLVTHSSIIHHLIEFLALALKGEGHIVIGDCPLQSCNFELM